MKKKIEEINYILNGFNEIECRDKDVSKVIYNNAIKLTSILDKEGFSKVFIEIEQIKHQMKTLQQSKSEDAESKFKHLQSKLITLSDEYKEISKKEVELELEFLDFKYIPKSDFSHKDIFLCRSFIKNI